MVHMNLALLLTVLPLLTVAIHNPPHIRHRRLSNSIRYVHDDDLDGRAVSLAGINDAHAAAHRVIKREVAKRGAACRPRQNSAMSTSTPTSTSAAWSEPSSQVEGAAAAAEGGSSTASSSISAQNAWAQHVRISSAACADCLSNRTRLSARPPGPRPPPTPGHRLQPVAQDRARP